jgi:transposase
MGNLVRNTTRNTVERLFGHLKECHRGATRYDKLAVRYHAFIKIACTRYRLTKPKLGFLDTD